ncbi:carcinoembryonic antigen-related cell adhesion molecule 5-like [Brachionichthys hirsutus]|uniref:carcinoembryonic antigen-related cell adhesion molecule 5-like n=1 Tax=Brachionichthys hirsutus TaxID=412623 RepID=UPI0036044081
MALLTLLWLVLASFTGLAQGAGVLPETPLNESVGGTVMFTTTVTPTETQFFAVEWKFGDKVIFYFNAKNTTGPEYEGRIRVFMSTGSLELRNLSFNDSGEYSLTIIPVGASIIRGSTRLTVYEPVSNVVLTVSSTDLVEFNSTVRLSCSSSGSSLSFLWMNGSSEVTSGDRVQITDGGSTLTIVSVSRYDQGPFRCLVSNPVSDGTSGPVNLSISYGPENITLTSSVQEYTKNGSNVILSCSAVSEPPSQFYWFLNGDKLPDTGPELKLVNVQVNQSGNYSCQAFNQKTGIYGDSQPSPLTVLEIISGVFITSSTNLTIEGNTVNLTCEAIGSVFTRTWMKDGSELVLTDSIMFHDGNRVLSFSRINRGDSGEYFCNVSSPVSSEGTIYSMLVNHGPHNVHITGPSEIQLGKTLALSCSAESRPPASFTWKQDGTVIHNSAVFTKNITDMSDDGVYTCQAMNNVTGRTLSAEHKLTVTGRTSRSLSDGHIIGICIACIAVFVIACLLIFLWNRNRQKGSNMILSSTAAEGKDNMAYSSQEPNYTDVQFIRNKNSRTNQLDLQNNSSEYAELRVNNNPPPASSPPTYDVYLQRKRGAAPQPDASVAELYAQVHKNRH